jgi:hypothetical protein
MSFSCSFVSIGIPSRRIPQAYHTFRFCPEKKVAPGALRLLDRFLNGGYYFFVQLPWGKEFYHRPKDIAMKRSVLFLGMIAVMLLSCESNIVTGRTNTEVEEKAPGPVDDFTIENLFNRETFDGERQLWLNQEPQNYSFHQLSAVALNLGQEDTLQYIINGEARYFRYFERFSVISEVSEPGTPESGSSGSGSASNIEYRPGKDLYTTNRRKKILLDEEGIRNMSIPITSLYAQIDDLAKKEGYTIYIRYDSQFHYPSHLRCIGTLFYRSLTIKDLVLDPEISGEDSAIDSNF